MAKKERQLLLDFLCTQDSESFKPDLVGVDWAEFVGQACCHRLGGLVFHVIREYSIHDIPSGAYYSLDKIFEAQASRTMLFRKHIAELSGAIAQAGIPCAFLKGAILANSVYEVGTRSSNDIDILLNPEDISRVEATLSGLGYEQGDFDGTSITKLSRKEAVFRRMNWGESAPYTKLIDEPTLRAIVVDMNFSLDWLPTGSESTIKAMLSQTKPYSIDGAPAPSLAEEDFLIHLCMHLYKEAVLYSQVITGKDMGLYKFVDIQRVIAKWPINWELLLSKTRGYGLEKEVYYVLYQLVAIFPGIGNKELSNVMEALKPADLSYLDRVISTEEKKTYIWKNTVLERLFDHNRMQYLIEE